MLITNEVSVVGCVRCVKKRAGGFLDKRHLRKLLMCLIGLIKLVPNLDGVQPSA